MALPECSSGVPHFHSMRAAIDQRTCIHCGVAFRPTEHRPDFCCAGCQFVHDLIAKNGLGQFYDLQESGVQPVKPLVFQKRDYTWLEELVSAVEKSPDVVLQLGLQGLSCIGCVWLIETLFSRKAGGLSLRVDSTMGQITLRWQPGEIDVVAFARELQTFGYLVGPPGNNDAPTNRALIVRLGICAALAMNTMLFTLPRYCGMGDDFAFAKLFHKLTLILGTLSFIIGGSYFFTRTWHSLRQRVLHIDLPISMGLAAAWLGSVYAWGKGAHSFVYFDFVSTFVFLMLAGRWLQQKAVERNRAQLLATQADPAPVRRTSGEKLPVTQIVNGDTFLVEAGGIVPVCSRLCSEGATLGMEWISGESEATTARRGRTIAAGSVNCGQSPIELEAMEPWSESLLAKLLRITPGAAPRNIALERFIRAYIIVAVTLALGGFFAWLAIGGGMLPAMQVLISVLVVSCPCASGVALPLTRDLATSQLRRLGVFIREGEVWTKLEQVRHVVFDKTGTLTLEAMTLLNPEVLRLLTAEESAVLLAMVQINPHPASGCLREQLLADGVEPALCAAVTETIGFGLEVKQSGAVWKLGRPEWAGGTKGDCVFSRDGEVLAAFHFGEEARADAVEEIATLRHQGHRVSILSGDRREKVDAMADRLHLSRTDCHAEMTPEGKAEWITRNDHRDTLYIGDGANDSLAFDKAWCTGTPAIDRGLLEQKSDFYFLGRGLNGIRALFNTATTRRRTAQCVVAFAIAYNAVAIALCLFGRMNPLMAAILMPASSLVSLAIVFIGCTRKKQ